MGKPTSGMSKYFKIQLHLSCLLQYLKFQLLIIYVKIRWLPLSDLTINNHKCLVKNELIDLAKL